MEKEAIEAAQQGLTKAAEAHPTSHPGCLIAAPNLARTIKPTSKELKLCL
jgi:hypothetical protein